jgi:GTP cyclohydrolase IA
MSKKELIVRKIFVTNVEIYNRCAAIAATLSSGMVFYGVPRGGIAPAYLISQMSHGHITDDPNKAHYIIDDLIDSGATRKHYSDSFPNAYFVALYEKEDESDWIVFPWERSEEKGDQSATDIFTRLLEYVGEDVKREGLLETPNRMAKMYTEVTRGYNEDPADYFKTFTEDASNYDEMIIVGPIPFYSLCEHHMVPFFGDVFVGYIPDKRFAGLSKLARVVNTFSRRLQIQERMSDQIAATIEKFAQPLGVGVIIKARHLCMEMRGVEKSGAQTTTSSMKGVFLTDTKARNEFLHLIKR